MIRPPAPRKDIWLWLAMLILLGLLAGTAGLAIGGADEYGRHHRMVDGMSALGLVVMAYCLWATPIYLKTISRQKAMPVDAPGAYEAMKTLLGVLLCYVLFPCIASIAGSVTWFTTHSSWVSFAIGAGVGVVLTRYLQSSLFSREFKLGRQL